MNTKRLTSISIKSVLVNLPLVYLALGLLVGIGSYIYLIVNPTAIAPRIGFFQWVLAILLYAAIFCVILSAVSVVGAWIYNMLAKKFGGVALNLDETEI